MLIIFGIVFVSIPYLFSPLFRRAIIWNKVGFWIIRHFGLKGSWSEDTEREPYDLIVMVDPRKTGFETIEWRIEIHDPN